MKVLKQCVLCMMLLCYLGIFEGRIAIFQDGQVAQVFPYYAQHLPEEAQKQLENGIPFSSKQELYKLLQDYLS